MLLAVQDAEAESNNTEIVRLKSMLTKADEEKRQLICELNQVSDSKLKKIWTFLFKFLIQNPKL